MRRASALPLDVHLMIAPVDPFIEDFAKAGADIITVHVEATPHVHRTIQTIRENSTSLDRLANQGTVMLIGAMYDVRSGEVDFFDPWG